MKDSDFEAVKKYLEEKGIKHYTLRQGNECIWASYGRIEAYFMMNSDSTIRGIIYD